jgi:hypothetical protein
MRHSIRKDHLVRRAVTPLFVGCMALGVPAVAVLGSPASASAATTAAASTDPLGPTIAQVEYFIGTVEFQACLVQDELHALAPGLVGGGPCFPPQ